MNWVGEAPTRDSNSNGRHTEKSIFFSLEMKVDVWVQLGSPCHFPPTLGS